MYLVAINTYGNRLILFEKRNETWEPIAEPTIQFAIDRLMVEGLIAILHKKQPFLTHEGLIYWHIEDLEGEIISLTCKTLGGRHSLIYKLYFIETTQFFTSLRDHDMEGLRDRLATFYLKAHLEKKKDEQES